MESSKTYEEQEKELKMIEEIRKIRQMQIKANCFYEKEIQPAVLNMALDLGLADLTDVVKVDDKVQVTLLWDDKFAEWELTKSIRCLLFAMLCIKQDNEQQIRLTLVAVGRVIESYKYLTNLIGMEVEKASKTVGDLV